MKRITALLYWLAVAAPIFSQTPAPQLAEKKGASPISNISANSTGSTRAVVIGISDYQEKDIPDLRFADKDAEAFANFLRSPAGGSLDKDHLIGELTFKQAGPTKTTGTIAPTKE